MLWLFLLFCIGGWLIDDVVRVSGERQRDLPIYIRDPVSLTPPSHPHCLVVASSLSLDVGYLFGKFGDGGGRGVANVCLAGSCGFVFMRRYKFISFYPAILSPSSKQLLILGHIIFLEQASACLYERLVLGVHKMSRSPHPPGRTLRFI